MSKKKRMLLVLTPEQEMILIAQMQAAGFGSKSAYIRYVLFMEQPLKEKIERIYEEVLARGI